MIYAIRAAGTRYIKFGRATDVLKRINEMQTGCPFDLELVAAADWPNEAESGIHRFLQNCRYQREWFIASAKRSKVIAWMNDRENGLLNFRQAAGMGRLGDKSSRAEDRVSGSWRVQIDENEARRAERRAWWEAKNDHWRASEQRSDGNLSTDCIVSD